MSKCVKVYFCIQCMREFKTTDHFTRHANRKMPRGMRCEQPLPEFKCVDCGKIYKSEMWARKHTCHREDKR